jgi:signal transduction histidine kinase
MPQWLKWRRWSLSAKLTVAVTLIVMLTIIGLAIQSRLVLLATNRLQLEQQAMLLLDTTAEVVVDPLYVLDLSTLTRLVEQIDSAQLDVLVAMQVYDAEGRLLADSAREVIAVYSLDPDPLGSQLIGMESHYFQWEGDQLLAGQTIQAGQQRLGAVSLRLTLQPVLDLMAMQRRQNLVTVLILVPLAAVITFWLTRLIVAPLNALNRAAGQVMAGDLSQRVTVADEGDEIVQLATTFNQMTDRLQEMVSDLANTRDQALEASAFKTRMLANVSHDLRTPLSSILGYTDILRLGMYGPLTDKQSQTLERIGINTNELLNFVNELLESASMDDGTLELTHELFAPADLLRSVEALVVGQAHRNGLGLFTDIDGKLPEKLVGDRRRLQHVLTNLVGNAIKFTESGAIHVRLIRTDDTHWSIAVRDTGAGILPEEQAHIFDAFWQADRSEQQSGVGLGLYIVKQLTVAMGGEIALESVPGQGSTFTVTLPLQTEMVG